MAVNPFYLFVTVLAAGFTQSFTGFGLALVAMPLLTRVVSIRTASPLLSLIAITAQVSLLLLRYRRTVNLKAVGPLLATSWIGVWLGIMALRRLDERLVTTALGAVIIGYALYALFAPHLPEIRDHRWAYLFGLLGGLLAGAYNASGPSVVIYGTCCRWEPVEFKSNLQVFFLFNSLLVLTMRVLSHDYSAQIFRSYLVALPALFLGIAAGLSLDKRVNPALFRKIVLWLLVGLGVQLIL